MCLSLTPRHFIGELTLFHFCLSDELSAIILQKHMKLNLFNYIKMVNYSITGCNKLNVPVVCSSILETTWPFKLKFYRHRFVIGTNFVLGFEKNLDLQNSVAIQQTYGYELMICTPFFIYNHPGPLTHLCDTSEGCHILFGGLL